jgi:hypothetical protein
MAEKGFSGNDVHGVDLEARQNKLANDVTYADEQAPEDGIRPLHQKLKSRHMQSKIYNAGPASQHG